MSSRDPVGTTRFAPSPTGDLHLGHAYAASQVFERAKKQGATAHLRIEDIDHTRCRPRFTTAIYEDLAWLGFDWPEPARKQSQHYAAYAKVIVDLVQRGLAYPCTLSRSQLKTGARTSRPDPLAHREAARICDKIQAAARFKTPSLPFTIRLNLNAALLQTQEALRYEESGKTLTGRGPLKDWAESDRSDPIIARRDIGTSYHIAVTHDDHIQRISHVIRGADFIDQTPLHVLLQALMGWTTPIYHHHALITDETGRKFSKSDQDVTIKSLREAGQSPEDVLSLCLSKMRSSL